MHPTHSTMTAAACLALIACGSILCAAPPRESSAALAQANSGRRSPPAAVAPKQTAPKQTVTNKAAPAAADPGDLSAATDKDPPGLKRLEKGSPVWLDAKGKRVVLVGEVCLRTGQLEMFACLKGTKEHESILAFPTKAYVIHAGLLAAGAVPGSPAKYDPKYSPAHGSEVEVALFWTDEKGKRQKAVAQDWIRDVKTGKAMTHPWVFGGSGFWTDEQTGEKHYLAEGGDLICVSNFTSAMLDLPIQSSATNADLLFDAFTNRIPPEGTKVTVVLTPKKKAQQKE